MTLAYLTHGRIAFTAGGAAPTTPVLATHIGLQELRDKIDREFDQTIQYVENDTSPPIDFQIVELDTADEVPFEKAFNLTGSTVEFKLRRKGRRKIVNTGHTTCTIIDPTTGQCRYNIVAGDFSRPGPYEGELEITTPGGVTTLFPLQNIIVRPEF